MKVIFLDVDGVLNSEQFARLRNRRPYLRERFGRPLAAIIRTILSWLPGKLDDSNWWSRFYLFNLTDHCNFCTIACANLEYVLEEVPDAYIVVSSVWRSWGMEYLKKILARNGIDPSRVKGRTGSWERVPSEAELGRKAERGDQISAWLSFHEDRVKGIPLPADCKARDELSAEPITHFVVIDDDSDMTTVMDHFVKTDSRLGLTLYDADKARNMLGQTCRCSAAKDNRSEHYKWCPDYVEPPTVEKA